MENKSEQLGTPINTTTHIEFKQAMQDFMTMFPKMDHDVIEEVLRANNGAVDATIDQLLSMTTDNLNEALRLHMEKMEKENMKSLEDKNLLNFPDVALTNPPFTNSRKKWSPPLLGPLPPTFLRIELKNQVF